jgi:sensor c-di-GMP phosphodiesterase-like protein
MMTSNIAKAHISNHILFPALQMGIYSNIGAMYYRYLSSTVSDFLKALNSRELAIHYQPIVDMQSGQWLGAEALLRWPKKGSEFSSEVLITALERAGLMQNVTRWICQQVVEDYCETIWACEDFYITINLSAADVMDHSFPDFMRRLLAEHKVPASRFAFEVTERVALNSQRAEVELKRLRAQGHLIALDDFGTGYSSLAYLDQLPVDIIKIDKSFTSRKQSPSSDIILSHLLHMAKKLDIDVIVEGVETMSQARRVCELGAQKAQGWLYSKDLPAHALVRAYFSIPHPSIDEVV